MEAKGWASQCGWLEGILEICGNNRTWRSLGICRNLAYVFCFWFGVLGFRVQERFEDSVCRTRHRGSSSVILDIK